MRGPVEGIALDMAAMRIGQRFDYLLWRPDRHAEISVHARLSKFCGAPSCAAAACRSICRRRRRCDHMLLGGLYDHVGGGFHRYCHRRALADSAFREDAERQRALISIMSCLIGSINRNPLCRHRIEETVGWMMRDMRVGDGFASSLDADCEGEEGKYYFWSEAEIDAALDGHLRRRSSRPPTTSQREGKFNGKNVRAASACVPPHPQSDADEALLKKQRELLLARARQACGADARRQGAGRLATAW